MIEKIDYSDEQICEMYLKKQFGTSKIVKITGLRLADIVKILAKHGIKLRTMRQAAEIQRNMIVQAETLRDRVLELERRLDAIEGFLVL